MSMKVRELLLHQDDECGCGCGHDHDHEEHEHHHHDIPKAHGKRVYILEKDRKSVV